MALAIFQSGFLVRYPTYERDVRRAVKQCRLSTGHLEFALLRGQQFSAHNVTTTLMLCGFHFHYCCLSC